MSAGGRQLYLLRLAGSETERVIYAVGSDVSRYLVSLQIGVQRILNGPGRIRNVMRRIRSSVRRSFRALQADYTSSANFLRFSTEFTQPFPQLFYGSTRTSLTRSFN